MFNLKVVINKCYGGFSLSWKAVERLKELGHPLAIDCNPHTFNYDGYLDEIERHDPLLVQVVEELGDEADGESAALSIKEIHFGYEIDDYDGQESIRGNRYVG